VLITSTGASTRIEGAKLSDDDVERLMRGLSMQKFADRDQQEVKGYYELLANVFDAWKMIKFSESTIKHCHQELLKYVEKDELHRGEYKKTENRVEMVDDSGKSIGVLFETTAAYLTAKEMQELVEWTQEVLEQHAHHPLLVIANFIVEFLNIHPFQDGNGRMSRILTNLLLLQQGYLYVPYVSHEKLIEDNKANYYLALRKSQKTFRSEHEDIMPWLEFFLVILQSQSTRAIELLTQENIEKILSAKQLAVWNYLQRGGEVSSGEIARNLSMSQATVIQALKKLLELKKIESLGLGRATRYKLIK
jgi:Fic family protein